MTETWADHLDSATEPLPSTDPRVAIESIPGLTVLAHPDVDRVGERVTLPELVGPGSVVELSRLLPQFGPITVGGTRPLADRRLSRSPLELERLATGEVVVARREHPGEVLVDGEPLGERVLVPAGRLVAGVVLLLARRVTLLLHGHHPEPQRPPSFGLVGESGSMLGVRRAIEKQASGSWSILIRGESGTGKELVARALHGAGERARRPFVTVNAGAIPGTLAAAELFGATAGAYSDAKTDRHGYFRRADGGVLFLDEVGAISSEVQVPLLRVLESGEVQPVGGGTGHRVDVRVLAATDADLEVEVEAGRFQRSLYYRLANGEVHIPPLRERREDVARLLVHFLRKELARIGHGDRLEPARNPWLRADLVAHLTLHDWRGNVRELRNLARQMVVEFGDQEEAELPAGFELRTSATGEPPAERAGVDAESRSVGSVAESMARVRRGYRNPATVDREELLTALRRHQHNRKATASALGVSRTSLYKLIEDHPEVRTAAELDTEEIRQAVAAAGGDVRQAARDLQVSERALKVRLGQLEDPPLS